MKVKELIKELKKFPPDAKCWAYEGESTGVSIHYKTKFGFIHCGEDSEKAETELLEEDR